MYLPCMDWRRPSEWLGGELGDLGVHALRHAMSGVEVVKVEAPPITIRGNNINFPDGHDTNGENFQARNRATVEDALYVVGENDEERSTIGCGDAAVTEAAVADQTI